MTFDDSGLLTDEAFMAAYPGVVAMSGSPSGVHSALTATTHIRYDWQTGQYVTERR